MCEHFISELSFQAWPRLSLVQPSFEIDAQSEDASNTLILNVKPSQMDHNKQFATLRVPFRPSSSAAARVTVRIWDDDIEVVAYGGSIAADISEWFAEALTTSERPGLEGVRLCVIRDVESYQRATKPRHSEHKTNHIQSALSDDTPLLLASNSSLAALNKWTYLRTVPMKCFRPNIQVTHSLWPLLPALPAWDEDCWETIRINDCVVDCVKPCQRCTMPQVVPDQGIKHTTNEPADSLAANHSDANGKPLFGVHGLHRKAGCSIAVGDCVHVLSRKAPRSHTPNLQ